MLNPLTWLRTAVKAVVVNGMRDGLADVATPAPARTLAAAAGGVAGGSVTGGVTFGSAASPSGYSFRYALLAGDKGRSPEPSGRTAAVRGALVGEWDQLGLGRPVGHRLLARPRRRLVDPGGVESSVRIALTRSTIRWPRPSAPATRRSSRPHAPSARAAGGRMRARATARGDRFPDRVRA